MKNKPKVKTKKTPEENFDFMKTNKDNLKNIVKNPETINIINELAIKTNKIVIHAYNFIVSIYTKKINLYQHLIKTILVTYLKLLLSENVGKVDTEMIICQNNLIH